LFAIVTGLVMADVLPASGVFAWLKNRDLVVESNSANSLRPAVSWWQSFALPMVLVVVTLFTQMSGAPIPVVGRGWVRWDPQRWPVDLMANLEEIESRKDGETRIINSLAFGGFLEFHTPRLKPFIDDRCELFGDKFLSDYFLGETRMPDRINDWAMEYHARYALVIRASPFDDYLSRSVNWKLIRRDAAGALFERQREDDSRVSVKSDVGGGTGSDSANDRLR
jgi:hypothetical protein